MLSTTLTYGAGFRSNLLNPPFFVRSFLKAFFFAKNSKSLKKDIVDTITNTYEIKNLITFDIWGLIHASTVAQTNHCD